MATIAVHLTPRHEHNELGLMLVLRQRDPARKGDAKTRNTLRRLVSDEPLFKSRLRLLKNTGTELCFVVALPYLCDAPERRAPCIIGRVNYEVRGL